MYCSKCGQQTADGAKFCGSCGAPIMTASPPQSPQPAVPPQPVAPVADPRMRGGAYPASPSPTQYASGKNPAVALILSLLIVGLGQFYNGDMKKELIMLGGAIVLGLLTLGLAWLGIAVWSAIDAYQVASGKGTMW